MLRASPQFLFFGAITGLSVWVIRRHGHGSLRSGARSLLVDWARYADLPSDPFWERLAAAWPWLVLLTIPVGWWYAKSAYGALAGDGYAWVTQAARMDILDPATLVAPFHHFGWAAILGNATLFRLSVLTASRIAGVAFATLASFVANQIARSVTSPRAFGLVRR